MKPSVSVVKTLLLLQKHSLKFTLGPCVGLLVAVLYMVSKFVGRLALRCGVKALCLALRCGALSYPVRREI